MKRIVVVIAHPAQYHFIKHAVRLLAAEGADIKILIRTKDVLEQLLIQDGVEYENIQPSYRKNNSFSMAFSTLQRIFKVFRCAKDFKADLIVGTDAAGVYAAWLLGIPSLATLEDDYAIIKKAARCFFPLTTNIIVPSVCDVGKWNYKKIPYFGYMKLAYLHPNFFSPQQDIVHRYGLPEKYCLIRLSKLQAYHDKILGGGVSNNLILSILDVSKRSGYNVYISSESELDESLLPYKLQIKETDIHHIMSFASLLISDSQSMSVEAAMLGVPSLRYSDFAGHISVLEELENRYELTYGIKTNQPELLLQMVEKLLSQVNLREEWQSRRHKMLADKIDVTKFLVWFISDYPQSRDIIIKNPDYQRHLE